MSDFVVVNHISNVLEKPKLCDGCRALVYGIFDEGEDYARRKRTFFHHSKRNILELQISQKDGCPICHMLVASLNSEAVKNIPPFQIGTMHASDTLFEPWSGGTVSIDFETCVTSQKTASQHSKRASIDAVFVDKHAWKNTKESEVALKTDDTITWECANHWLQECAFAAHGLPAHKFCRKPAMPNSKLPKRLIYIPPGDESFTNVRLCCSEHVLEQFLTQSAIRNPYKESHLEQRFQHPDKEPSLHARPGGLQYVALSHCWGKKIPVTTTRDNIDEMFQNIHFSMLSKTFQDAILATFRLGLEYLWIDSLCIIQGDDQDWTEEASQMGSIYANSILNIIAADADDGSIGCFFHRNLSRLYGCTIYPTPPENKFDFSSCALCLTPSKLSSSTENCRTSSRAWCFQETFLAPRSLYFCKTQLFWVCRAGQACETLPNWRNWPPWTELVDRRIALRSESSKAATIEAWVDLVSSYTQGRLTYAKDKLTAFSGVARLYHKGDGLYTTYTGRNLRPPYFAGIWTGKLLGPIRGYGAQLLWYVSSDERRVRNLALKAPSWSWASVDSPVDTWLIKKSLSSTYSYQRSWSYKTTFDLVIKDVNVQLSTLDIFGEVVGGSIELECRVTGPFALENYWLRPSNGGGSATEEQSNQATDFFSQVEVFRDVMTTGNVEVYCAQAWRVTSEVSDWNSGDRLRLPVGALEAAGLLLQKLPNGNFKRVGVYVRRKSGYYEINPLVDKTIITVV